jgi:hypothetical protein
METGLVKTTSLTAAPAATPRPRGTVRAVGLFSSVTSRQADVPARWSNGDTSRGSGAPASFSGPAGFNAPSGGNAPAGFNAPSGGNAPAGFNAPSSGHAPFGSSAPSSGSAPSGGSGAPASSNAAAPFHDLDRGSRHAEYLLVIYPGGELEEKILGEQKQFSDDYAVTVRNKPHITVAAFQAGEVMEETLIRWIQRICSQYQSFDLMLNNYSGFPPHTVMPAEPALRVPGTIYLRVQDPQPFKFLMQQLQSIDEFIRSSGCPPVHFISRPFLCIAGGLTEQVYNKAMPDYSRRTFNETFHVRELVLLKRTHAFDPCKTLNIFRLRAE